VIVVICDNDSIHHARAVTVYLEQHPRLELLYGARYSPHDNPVERVWAGLKNYVANTAVTWPGRLRQIHAYFRNRSPGQMLATAAPWTSPWLAPSALVDESGRSESIGATGSRSRANRRHSCPRLLPLPHTQSGG
jgi:hypothetical protein